MIEGFIEEAILTEDTIMMSLTLKSHTDSMMEMMREIKAKLEEEGIVADIE